MRRNNKKISRKENQARLEINLFILVAVLIISFAFILFGNITGLFVVGEPVYMENVSYSFEQSSTFDYSFKFAPTSVRLSGTMVGNGSAKVYLVSRNNSYLVLDIDADDAKDMPITGLAISNGTDESTTTNLGEPATTTQEESTATTLEEMTTTTLEPATTTFEPVPTTISGNESENSLPVWLGGLNTVVVNMNSEVTIDLSQYFADKESSQLTFITGGADNFNVVLNGNLATLIPDKNFQGNSKIKFLASDGELSTLSPEITLKVVESGAPKEKIYTIPFNSLCIETCVMPKIEKDAYFEVVLDDAKLNITKITFSYQNIEENKPPYFYDIPPQTWYQDTNHTINLSYYSNDPDNDPLSYSSTSTDNIRIGIDGSIATLIPDKGWFGNETVQFIVSDQNYSVLSKEVLLEVLPIAQNITPSKRTEETIQVMAVINRPVKWIKKVKLNESTANITINITSEAENIKVNKIVGSTSTDITGDVRIRINDTMMDLKKVEKDKKIEDITGFAVVGPEDTNGLITRLVKFFTKPSVTGRAVQDIDSQNISVTNNASSQDTAQLFIGENVTEVHIEYFTEAPTAIEKNISKGLKQVIVSSNIPYKNVLAYTDLDTQVPSYAIKVYWLVNRSEYNQYMGIVENTNLTQDSKRSYALDITDREGFGVNFKDYDENGLMDYVEWIAPHLSNQTFEISINILNVQSYPMVGGNWTVAFTTIGTANLTISAVNDTTYSEIYNDNETTVDDLEILKLSCRNNTLFDKYGNYNNGVEFITMDGQHLFLNQTFNSSYPIRSLFIKDYSCPDTAYYTVKAITPGIHNQMFEFGFDRVFANNFANYAPITDVIAFADGNYTNTRYFG